MLPYFQGNDLMDECRTPQALATLLAKLVTHGKTRLKSVYDPTCGSGSLLLRVAKEGPTQQIRAIEIEGPLPICDRPWPLMSGDKKVGQVTSAAMSPDYGEGAAIGMVRMTHWDPGTQLHVQTPDGLRPAEVREKFWI